MTRKNLIRWIIGAVAFAVLVAVPVFAQIQFSDVPEDEDNIRRADIQFVAEEGWFAGYPDGTFKPDRNISPDQMTTVLTRAFGEGITREEFASFLRWGNIGKERIAPAISAADAARAAAEAAFEAYGELFFIPGADEAEYANTAEAARAAAQAAHAAINASAAALSAKAAAEAAAADACQDRRDGASAEVVSAAALATASAAEAALAAASAEAARAAASTARAAAPYALFLPSRDAGVAHRVFNPDAYIALSYYSDALDAVEAARAVRDAADDLLEAHGSQGALAVARSVAYETLDEYRELSTKAEIADSYARSASTVEAYYSGGARSYAEAAHQAARADAQAAWAAARLAKDTAVAYADIAEVAADDAAVWVRDVCYL